MDVDCDNFEEALAAFQAHLRGAAFVAVDLEFSGLHLRDGRDRPDDPEEHYQEARLVASTFGIIQIGICLFEVSDDVAEAPSQYVTRPFNFFVCPRPVEDQPSEKFALDAESIHYVRCHDLDLGRWMDRGVTFVDSAGEKLLRRNLAAGADAQLSTSLGFRRLWTALAAPGAPPIVLHNGLYDLLYLVHWLEEPLPETMELFCPIALKCFRGGVFDTKWLASCLDGILGLHTSLEELSDSLDRRADHPLCTFAAGFDKYEREGCHFHEAAWDAYCTGKLFAYYKQRNPAPTNTGNAADFEEEKSYVIAKNQIFLGRGDVQELSLNRGASELESSVVAKPLPAKAARYPTQREVEALDEALKQILTPEVIQAALGEAHQHGGDLDAAAAILRQQVSQHFESKAPHGPQLSVSLKDEKRQPLPTRVARLPRPLVGEAHRGNLGCVHCRSELTVEVSQSQAVSSHDAKAPVTDAKCAYATLLYGGKSEYFIGALVLGWKLENTGSKVTRLLLHTSDVPQRFLSILSWTWKLRHVEYLDGSATLFKNFQGSRFQRVFTKLQVLSCTDFDKILMLDLDLNIRRNIDELFKLEAPAAMRRSSGRNQPGHAKPFAAEDIWHSGAEEMSSGINAGVMLLKPDQNVLNRMIAEVTDDSHPEHVGTYGPEQDYMTRFYSAFLPGWTHIGAEFNYQLGLPPNYVSKHHASLDILRDVAVAHFSGREYKPWEIKRGEKMTPDVLRQLLWDDNWVSERFPISEDADHGELDPADQDGWKMDDDHRPAVENIKMMDGMPIRIQQSTGPKSYSADVVQVIWEWIEDLRSMSLELDEANGIDLAAELEAIDHSVRVDLVDRGDEDLQGKGKGKGKGEGKSFGKGCFNCGGDHKARDCPKNPGNNQGLAKYDTLGYAIGGVLANGRPIGQGPISEVVRKQEQADAMRQVNPMRPSDEPSPNRIVRQTQAMVQSSLSNEDNPWQRWQGLGSSR